MTRAATSLADERLRAATAARAEREHLLRMRPKLADDVATEEQRVQQLARELAREQQDVERLTTGILGFLSEILGAGEAELAREQREVLEADVRLREAVASRDGLRDQVTGIDARLARLDAGAIDAEIRAARAACEAALIQAGTSEGADLQEIAIRIESIDIELVPLEDAVAAGNAALAALSEVLVALDGAGAGATDEARKRVDRARGLAGDVQARLTMFLRALDDLARPDDALPLEAPVRPEAFIDEWVRALFARGDPAARIAAARATMFAKLEGVRAQLGPLRTRHDELAARRGELVRRRERVIARGLIDPASA